MNNYKCIKCINKCCIKGPTGATGPTGPATETIAVGSTTTGTPGTLASVTDSGTAPNHVFDFVIPAGMTGIDRTCW